MIIPSNSVITAEVINELSKHIDLHDYCNLIVLVVVIFVEVLLQFKKYNLNTY